MTQATPQFFRSTTSRQLLAAAVGLEEDRLLPDGLPAEVVSTAVPQLMVPAQGLKDLEAIELDLVAMRKIFKTMETDCFMIFTRQTRATELHCPCSYVRPELGVPEDPATGSAAGALGAYLVRHGVLNASPTAHLIVEQGYEMGRPSTIYVEVDGTETPDRGAGGWHSRRSRGGNDQGLGSIKPLRPFVGSAILPDCSHI